MTDPAADPTDPDLSAQIRAALSGADPGTLAYLDIGARLDRVSAVHAGSGAVAWRSLHATWDRPWIIAMGADPQEVARCVTSLADRTGRPEGITIARPAFVRLPERLRPVEHWEWDWWFTRTVPAPRPGEDRVLELALDDPRIAELLELASPDAMAWPGDRRIRRWAGIEGSALAGREGAGSGGAAPPIPDTATDRAAVIPPQAAPPLAPDVLVAVATVTSMRPGIPHLGSVATRPGWRGRGLARDLCARLTREELERGAVAVTLGMHAANRSARPVYQSLGYTVGYHWASGRLQAGADPHH